MIADSDAGKIKVAKLSDKITAMTDCGGRAKTFCRRIRAFTLIELMAVVLVILVLAAIGISVAGYVQKKVAIATTKSQIAAIEAALESYKSDWGYYPRTSSSRISSNGSAETTNNAILFRALFLQSRRYLNIPAPQVHANLMTTYITNNIVTNIFDVFGKSFNYYCSPTTPYSLVNASPGYTFGGQMNVSSYDLFSYGPDQWTLADRMASSWPTVNNVRVWTNATYALDDITNWSP